MKLYTIAKNIINEQGTSIGGVVNNIGDNLMNLSQYKTYEDEESEKKNVEPISNPTTKPIKVCTSNPNMDKILMDNNISDYTYQIKEYNTQNQDNPTGFNVDINKEDKNITINIFSKNKTISNKVSWENINYQIKDAFKNIEDIKIYSASSGSRIT
jgi:hypothetical protein